jgi:hypothetical protein
MVGSQRAKPIPDALATEIAHRRQRRQPIFSWAGSILVAITGGTIGLTFKEHKSLSPAQKAVLSVAIGVPGAHAIIWIDHHWEAEKRVRRNNGTQSAARRAGSRNAARKDWTTLIALVLLAVAALLAVLIPIE